jgi:purine-nucleoside phosphorylase
VQRDVPDLVSAMEHEAANPYLAAEEAADALRPKLRLTPQVAIILGTGLGSLAEQLTEAASFPYADLPHFPRSTVLGHAGQLVVGRLAGVPVAALQGRFHMYEGYRPAQVVHPVRVLGLLGARVLVVTNAAGGLDPAQQPGDLMLVRDHIGLPMLAGLNPLAGPNDERLGPRFPAMTAAYDPILRAQARAVAAERGIPLREGVYVMVAGPSYETPAELVFLRRSGADAVGMSTVPEVVAAHHMGLRVLAVSCITNLALTSAEAAGAPPSHQEVVAVAETASARLADLITGVVARIGAEVGQAPT